MSKNSSLFLLYCSYVVETNGTHKRRPRKPFAVVLLSIRINDAVPLSQQAHHFLQIVLKKLELLHILTIYFNFQIYRNKLYYSGEKVVKSK